MRAHHCRHAPMISTHMPMQAATLSTSSSMLFVTHVHMFMYMFMDGMRHALSWMWVQDRVSTYPYPRSLLQDLDTAAQDRGRSVRHSLAQSAREDRAIFLPADGPRHLTARK